MSDYLSRVAERASGVPTGVRPLLPSLFDPEKASAIFAPEFAEANAAAPEARPRRRKDPAHLEDEISFVQERVAGSKAAPVESPVESFARDEKNAAPDISGPSIIAPVMEPKPEKPAARKPPARQVSLESREPAPETASDRPAKLSHARPESPAHLRSFLPALEALPAKSHLEKIPADAEVPPPRRPAADNVFRPPAEPVKTDAAASTKGSPQKVSPALERQGAVVPAFVSVPRESTARLSHAMRENQSLAKESSAARTIRVTIGRIEVRAIHPPPEPPRRPRPVPAAPKMSLDDYLRSRNGGTG